MLNLRGLALLSALIWPVAAASQVPVPPHVAERAMAIAIAAGGPGTRIEQVAKAPEVPGLSSATVVAFVDGAGKPQRLIMLPDGEHFIPGDLLKISPHALPNLQAAPGEAQQPPIAPKTTGGRYEPNTWLEPQDFDEKLRGEIFDREEDVPAVYYGILSEVPAIVDGAGGPVLHVMYDPACIYCTRKYEGLRPLIDRGAITVRWIPVIGPSKPPFEALLALADVGAGNTERLRRLSVLASRRPLDVELVDRAQAENVLARTNVLREMLRANNDPNRSAGTPQTFYQLPDGRIRHLYGYNESHLQLVVQDFSLGQ